MVNAWRAHVKKTLEEMRSKASDGKVMLKDVLKAAGKTYKKVGSSSTAKKTKKAPKKKAPKKKASKKARKSSKRKSSKRK